LQCVAALVPRTHYIHSWLSWHRARESSPWAARSRPRSPRRALQSATGCTAGTRKRKREREADNAHVSIDTKTPCLALGANPSGHAEGNPRTTCLLPSPPPFRSPLASGTVPACDSARPVAQRLPPAVRWTSQTLSSELSVVCTRGTRRQTTPMLGSLVCTKPCSCGGALRRR